MAGICGLIAVGDQPADTSTMRRAAGAQNNMHTYSPGGTSLRLSVGSWVDDDGSSL
jgi:hypothetical protein